MDHSFDMESTVLSGKRAPRNTCQKDVCTNVLGIGLCFQMELRIVLLLLIAAISVNAIAGGVSGGALQPPQEAVGYVIRHQHTIACERVALIGCVWLFGWCGVGWSVRVMWWCGVWCVDV